MLHTDTSHPLCNRNIKNANINDCAHSYHFCMICSRQECCSVIFCFIQNAQTLTGGHFCFAFKPAAEVLEELCKKGGPACQKLHHTLTLLLSSVLRMLAFRQNSFIIGSS